MSQPTTPVTPAVLGVSHPECDRLVQLCERLSAEAYSVEGLGDLLTESAPRLVAGVKDAFRFMTTWDYSRPEMLHVSSVRAKLSKAQYTDLEEFLVDKPAGFKGNLALYAEELQHKHLPLLVAMRKDVIEATTKRFSYYINDLGNLNERRLTPVNPKFSQAVLSQHLTEESKYLLANNRSSEAYFVDLYNRNQDCLDAMARVNTINEQRWTKANPRDVAKATHGLSEVAKTFMTTVQSHGKETISKQVLGTLADELQLAARWVEWYSVMLTRIIDTTSALKTTERKLLRAL